MTDERALQDAHDEIHALRRNNEEILANFANTVHALKQQIRRLELERDYYRDKLSVVEQSK